MVNKLSQDILNKIIENLKNNINIKDIMKEFNLSRATIYRIKKEKLNNNETLINETIVKTEDETNNETEDQTNNETEDNNETENDTNNVSEENNISEENKNNDFNIDQFKRELNNSLKSLENEDNNVSVNKSINKSINQSVNQSFISKKSNVQFKNVSKPQIIKRDISVCNDKNNNILDTIKNCNIASNIDELKEIRSTIIIIKQYINTFPNELKNIYGNNRYVFEKKLFTLKLEQLKVILEDVRITINIKSNKSSFLTISQGLLKGIETLSNYSGYDVSGLEVELMNDPDFLLDLQIISAETDLSKYLNPKSSAFLKVVRKAYILNSQNKMKKTISDINMDSNLLNKIKNLDIKK